LAAKMQSKQCERRCQTATAARVEVTMVTYSQIVQCGRCVTSCMMRVNNPPGLSIDQLATWHTWTSPEASVHRSSGPGSASEVRHGSTNLETQRYRGKEQGDKGQQRRGPRYAHPLVHLPCEKRENGAEQRPDDDAGRQNGLRRGQRKAQPKSKGRTAARSK
jgi:alkylhydroperoxidase family enzyme